VSHSTATVSPVSAATTIPNRQRCNSCQCSGLGSPAPSLTASQCQCIKIALRVQCHRCGLPWRRPIFSLSAPTRSSPGFVNVNLGANRLRWVFTGQCNGPRHRQVTGKHPAGNNIVQSNYQPRQPGLRGPKLFRPIHAGVDGLGLTIVRFSNRTRSIAPPRETITAASRSSGDVISFFPTFSSWGTFSLVSGSVHLFATFPPVPRPKLQTMIQRLLAR